MAESTIWWLLAGVFFAAELLTGTFYLLLFSLGLVAAAIAAHAGAPVTLQLVTAAIVGGGSAVAWRGYKLRRSSTSAAATKEGGNLDIDQTVYVDSWEPDGTSSVKYRGAQWRASLLPGALPAPGFYTIVEVVGSRLVVKKL